ncbi:hypothetical protein NCC78_17480 [Micromonospora phytophila]|uniref:hypothetical protein n=1 Tax=Micromonospora phytophila TaxID=709888 RepID=UPI002030B180|nr:hypothetical protein [Micromonospora phytophila]MCM0676464.1 hypothetical protein [Micromonospora phytophila]
MEASIAAVFLYALSLLVFYWVIRLAVRHAIQDADKRRSLEWIENVAARVSRERRI